MNQKFDHPSCKVLVTGTSGTGKTTLFEKLLRKEKARHKFVFDHQGEFANRFHAQPCRDEATLLQRTAEGGLVAFDPVEMFPGNSPEAFEFFCKYVFAVSDTLKGRKILACDELQKLTGNRDEPGDLLAILDTGRRFQLDCFFISQSPNRIHNGIRNQLTQIYTFRQSDAQAIKYLSENSFDENAVRNLPRGKFLWRNLDTGETCEGGKAFEANAS